MPNFQCILHCCILDCGDLVAPFMFCSASPSPYPFYNSNLFSFYRRQPTCGFKSSPWRSDRWPHVGFPPLVSCPIFLQFCIHPSSTCTKYLWALFDYFLSCLVGIFVHANSSCFCFCCIFQYVPPFVMCPSLYMLRGDYSLSIVISGMFLPWLQVVYQQVLHPLPSMLDLYSSQTSYHHYYPSVFPTMILVYLKSRIGIFNFSSLVLTSHIMCISNLTSFWGFPVIVQVVGWFENWRRNFMFHYVWFHWFLCGGGEHKTTNSIGMCVCVCVCFKRYINYNF